MTIDAHHHFWNFSPEEYGWIDESMRALRRDFGPTDLRAELAAAGVDGAVTVQARQTLSETEELLRLAAAHDFICGVVGWVPLIQPDVGAQLVRLAADPWLRGVRHVLQDEPDEGYMLREDFRRGLGLLREHGLVYDLLIYPRHLPAVGRLVDRFPEQPFVLDHVAKPPLRYGDLNAWAAALRELARRPHVACKFSGLVTEADHVAWTENQIRACFDVALEAFGPQRLLFGTDWPVCLLATTYGRWVALVRRLLEPLAADERAAILGGNAVRIYGLDAARS